MSKFCQSQFLYIIRNIFQNMVPNSKSFIKLRKNGKAKSLTKLQKRSKVYPYMFKGIPVCQNYFGFNSGQFQKQCYTDIASSSIGEDRLYNVCHFRQPDFVRTFQLSADFRKNSFVDISNKENLCQNVTKLSNSEEKMVEKEPKVMKKSFLADTKFANFGRASLEVKGRSKLTESTIMKNGTNVGTVGVAPKKTRSLGAIVEERCCFTNQRKDIQTPLRLNNQNMATEKNFGNEEIRKTPIDNMQDQLTNPMLPITCHFSKCDQILPIKTLDKILDVSHNQFGYNSIYNNLEPIFEEGNLYAEIYSHKSREPVETPETEEQCDINLVNHHHKFNKTYFENFLKPYSFSNSDRNMRHLKSSQKNVRKFKWIGQ